MSDDPVFDFNPGDPQKVIVDRSIEPDIELETIIVLVEQQWLVQHTRATVTNVLQMADQVGFETNQTAVSRVLGSEEFLKRMTAKGIFWPRNWSDKTSEIAAVLNPQQLAAIAVLTDPTKTGTMKSKLEAVGVSYATYRNWLKNPVFKNAMTKVGEELLNESMASVHTAVTQRAANGDIGAAKLYYDVTGRLTSNHSQMRDVAEIINLLLEVITRHITDVGMLAKINKDVELVLSGGTLHTPEMIEAHDPNVEDAVVVEESDPAIIQPGFFDFDPNN